MNNSALKTIRILTFIAEASSPLGVSEISRALGYAKSTVFDILTVLREEGFLEYADEAAKTFCIGRMSFRVGNVYLKGKSLHKAAKPILERLAEETGETVYLAVEDNGYILYLDRVAGTSPVVFLCDVGARNLLQVTGIGKAILAGFTDEVASRLVGDKLQKRTKNTLVTLPALLTELETIRKNGYAIDNGEDVEIVRCVGAPVRDVTGNVIAGISVSMLEQSFEGGKKEATIQSVTKAALELSHRLGYTGDKLYPDVK